MRTTTQLSITLPNVMADEVKKRVVSGIYASESEVVRDGLRALFARESAVENWLRTQVVSSIEAVKADPSSTMSSAEMKRFLSGLRAHYDSEQDS